MIYFVIFLEFILDFLSESITIERERTALCGRVVFGGSGFWTACLSAKDAWNVKGI